MARDWSAGSGKEGSARRQRGSGGALKKIFGIITKKNHGKEDGWEMPETDGGRTNRGGKGQNK